MVFALIRFAKQFVAAVTVALGLLLVGWTAPALAQSAPFTVSSVSQDEGNSGTTNFVFTVTLNSPAPAGGQLLSVFVCCGTASSISDYGATPTSVSIAEGTTTGTVTVPVIGDTVSEPDETFEVRVSGAIGGPPRTATGIGTIRNDDGASPSVTISAPAAQNEGNSGTTNFVFTVTSNIPAPAGGLTVNASVSGAATSGTDYNFPPSSATIAAGQTTGSFTIAVIGDTVPELDESLQVTLFAGSGYVVGATGSATTSILNDDGPLPTVTISAPAAQNEGNSGTTNFVYTVTSSVPAATGGLSVQLSLSGGTASPGSDYNFPPTSVLIPAGQTSVAYTVAVIGDTVPEPDETLVVNVVSPLGGTYQVGSPSSASTTIVNDDGGTPTATISAPAVQDEGNGGTTNFVFTVSLSSPAPAGGLSISVSTTGTAQPVTDYNFPVPGSVAIPAGQTSGTVTIAVVGDTVSEPDETLTVSLNGGAGYTVGSPSSATTTIRNDDGATPVITISAPAAQNEGNSGTTNFVFTVTSTVAAPTGGLTINANTTGTATFGGDYTAPSSVTIAAGQTSASYTVAVVGDTVAEQDETLQVILFSGAGYQLGSPSSASTTILNDDGPVATVTISAPAAQNEGNTGTTNFVYTVTSSVAAPAGGLTVNVGTLTGTATIVSDYVGPTPSTVIIPAGQTTAQITIAVIGDTIPEPDETLTVPLTTGVGYQLAGPSSSATATILNDDGLTPVVSISAPAPQNEGTGGTTNLVFTVTSTVAAPSGGITVNLGFEFGGSTATQGVDFNAPPATVVIPAGQTSAPYTVVVVADAAIEADETLRIGLRTGTGYTVGIPSTATATILNDDTTLPTLSINDVSFIEGNSSTQTLVFTVTLSAAAPPGGVTFTAGTADDTAVAPVDYTAINLVGQTIAAGQTTATITVLVNGDTTVEPDERFFVNITNVTGATVADGQGVGTIRTDDFAPPPNISVADVTVVEGNSGNTDMIFTVTLSGPAPAGGVSFTPSTTTAVNVGPGESLAAPGSDFVSLSGPAVVIPAGQTTATVRVSVIGDTTFENTEVVGLVLANLVNALPVRTLAAGRITNDDAQPTLSISDAQVLEGTDSNSVLTFTISLSEVSGAPVQATVSTASGTAVQGTDFVAVAATPVTIAPGSRTATVQVFTLADDVEEANENFTITLTPVSGASAGTRMTGTGTILNDDLDLVITPATLGPAQVGVAFSQAFDVSNGTGPYGFILLGTLPAGLTFADPGVISGTPTAGGTFQLEVLAVDSSDPSIGGPFVGTRSYTLVVAPATIVLPAVTLPGTVQGTAYSASLQPATGGTPGYTYALTGGALPAGITFNPTTLTLSGTPTEFGTFSFTVTATDSSTGTGPYSGTRTYSIQVAERPPVAANSALTVDYGSAATVVPLSLSGGTATSVAVVTAPANGTVTVDGLTIRYRPNAGFGGSDSFTYTASNSGGTSAPATVSVTVLPPVLTVTTTGALTGTVGTPYSLTFEFAGGAAPFTGYAVTGLPAGLSITASTPRSVTVSGTPTQAGSFTLEATARDSSTGAGPYTARGSAAVTIAAPVLALQPATTSFTATYITPFSQAFTATGGTGSFSYAQTGTLPRGLSFANGTLSGTPTQSGTFNFTVTATDTVATGAGAPFRVSRDYTMTIAAPVITATPTALPAATAGRAYTASLTGSGGAAPYSFTLSSGSLPPGVTLSAAGALSGTPTSSGTFAFVVRVTDANGESGTVNLSVTVSAPVLSITPATLPDARQGVAYSQTFVASGGIAPYTFAVSSGALPAGLTLNATTGVLSGTPTGSGPAAFAITATDSTGGTPGRGTVSFTLQVIPRPDPALDPEVRSLTQTQVESARRLSEVQVGNFRRRLDGMRSGNGSGGGGSAGGFQNGITIAGMERCPPQTNPWVASVCARSEGRPGLMGLSGGGDGGSSGLGARDSGGSGGGSPPAGTGERRWTVWTGGTIRFGERDPTTGLVRQEFEAEGLSLGADYRFSPTFAAGVGIGYGSDTVDVGTNGSRSRAEAMTLTVYGSHLLGEGFYADWVAGYQTLDFDLRRYVTATGGTILSSRSGSQLFLSASAGADLNRGGWRITPYGRLDITRGTLDAYSEVSTSLFALTFQEQDIQSTALGVGSTFAYSHDFEGGTFAPRFSIQYMYDLDWNGDALLTYADRVSGPFSTISLTGYSRTQWELGAGFEVRWGEALAVEIEYLNRIASGVASDNTFRFGVRYAF